MHKGELRVAVPKNSVSHPLRKGHWWSGLTSSASSRRARLAFSHHKGTDQREIPKGQGEARAENQMVWRHLHFSLTSVHFLFRTPWRRLCRKVKGPEEALPPTRLRQHGTCSCFTRLNLNSWFPWDSFSLHRTGLHLPLLHCEFQIIFSNLSPELIPLILSKYPLLFPSQHQTHTCVMQETKIRSVSVSLTVWFPWL